MSCGFVGNADIYGIGIRIGYYAQALAVWFSNYFLYREAKALRASNNLFLLALTIAATIYFVNASTTHVVEAFLMLQIGLVIGLVGITERSRYSSKYVKSSQERLFLRMVIIMAGGLFNVCFWWREIDRMLPTPCNDLDSREGNRDKTYIFYIVKANIYGWAGILMKVKSLAAVVWTAPKIITFDAVVLFYNFRLRATRAAFISAVESAISLHGQSRKPHQDLLRKERPKIECLQLQSLPTANKPRQSGSESRHDNTAQANQLRSSQAIIDSIMIVQQDDIIANIELLERIDHAIQYMETLFSIYPTSPPAMGRKRLVRICGRTHFYLPQHESHCTDTSTSYSQCCWTTLKSQFTNNPPFHLRWRLALHMTASGQHPPWRWPRLVHRMYILSETSKPPDWRHVSIASDVLLTQIPLVITTRTWMLTAVYQFVFIVVLILQVELTIAWNHVSGLQSLSTLGQLIPFIIGVGWLIKVLWGKWRLVSKGREEVGLEEGGAYEKAMARYLERKQAVASRAVVRAATA